MLEALTSSLSTFKPSTFKPGLNIVLATRTKKATSKDSRNAVGKSSVVALIDFLLGADANPSHIARRPELQEEWFTLRLQLEGASHTIERSGSELKYPRLDGTPIELSQLRSILARQFFGLHGRPDEPSMRGVMAFYLRNRDDGGFIDPLRTHSRQTNTATAAALAHLFTLDRTIPIKAAEIAASKTNVRALTKATKDPLFGRVLSSAKEIDAEIGTLRLIIDKVRADLASFKVVDQYAEYRSEADLLTRTIRAINDAATIAELKRSDLRSALESEEFNKPDYGYVAAVYEQVGLAIPDRSLQSYEKVRQFHASVVRNRRMYLEDELITVESQIVDASQQLRDLDTRRAEVMRVLEEGGALETFSALQRQVSELEGQLAALQERKDAIDRMKNATKHLKAESISLERKTSFDLADRRFDTEVISSLYTQIAFEIYGKDRPAALGIDASEHGYLISPTLGGERSGGIGSVAMFCFDLTMAVTAWRAGAGPDFLVHDSHLFDSIETRQIGAALRVASQVCAAENMQYIATINSDVLETALAYEPELDFHQSVTLTDQYETGGLFGIRFD